MAHSATAGTNHSTSAMFALSKTLQLSQPGAAQYWPSLCLNTTLSHANLARSAQLAAKPASPTVALSYCCRLSCGPQQRICSFSLRSSCCSAHYAQSLEHLVLAGYPPLTYSVPHLGVVKTSAAALVFTVTWLADLWELAVQQVKLCSPSVVIFVAAISKSFALMVGIKQGYIIAGIGFQTGRQVKGICLPVKGDGDVMKRITC